MDLLIVTSSGTVQRFPDVKRVEIGVTIAGLHDLLSAAESVNATVPSGVRT